LIHTDLRGRGPGLQDSRLPASEAEGRTNPANLIPEKSMNISILETALDFPNRTMNGIILLWKYQI
jgi:hypothetical protein